MQASFTWVHPVVCKGIYLLNSRSVPAYSPAEGFSTLSSAVVVKRQSSLQAQMQSCVSTAPCWSSPLLCWNKAVLWVTYTSTTTPCPKSNQYLGSDPLQLTLVSTAWNSFTSTDIPTFTHSFQVHAPIPLGSVGENMCLWALFILFTHDRKTLLNC